MLKVNNGKTRAIWEYSKLIMKIFKNWTDFRHRSGASIVDLEQVNAGFKGEKT